MTDEHFMLLARSVIRLAQMACRHPRCGAESTDNHATRCCDGCPLDAVDELAAELGRVAWERAEALR